MTTEQKYSEDLHHIRRMMERSSRFISLSGLSGVLAGIYALGAGLAAHYIIGYPYVSVHGFTPEQIRELILLGVGTIILTLITGIVLTRRKARAQGLPAWDASSKNLLINLAIPLIAGGLVCLFLWRQGLFILAPPLTLVFYGLALLNASYYTYSDIRILGIAELALGIFALFYTGHSLISWMLGFGLFHIVYGIWMYMKYEK